MSNSPLINYTKISPHSTNPRTGIINTITIHHMAGNLSVETCGNVFSGSREASSNYGIDSNGRVGLYVDEANRAWTSSNSANDNKAVTIEVANDGGDPDWHVSDKALNKLIDLCVDICKRNGIPKLNYTGDKSGNLTRHNMFAATGCPGPYLQSKFPYIADEVNKKLGIADAENKQTKTIKAGDLVKMTSDAKYYNGADVPLWVKKQNWYIASVSGDRAVLGKSEDGKYNIVSPMNTVYLTVVKAASSATPAKQSSIKVGSTVKLKDGAKTYDGKSLASFVHKRNHKVKEIKGDRVVITYLGIVIAAVKLSDLVLVK